MFEELDNFLEFLLRFVSTRYIAECDFDLISTAHTCPALAERHHTATAALCLLHDEEPDTDEQQDGQDRREHLRPPGRFGRIFRRDVNALRGELLIEIRVIIRRIGCDGRELRAIRQRATDGILDDDHLGDLAGVYLMQELGIFHFLPVRISRGEIIDNGYRHQDDEQIKPYIA